MPRDTYQQTRKVRKTVSLCFLVVVFLVVLFFGLNPRTLSFANHVDWIKDQSGIRFGKQGMAYTNGFAAKTEGNISDSKAFSIELALKLEKTHKDGFKFVFVLHNGQDSSQLLMAQWRSWLILMNGDDYANKRKTKRLAVDTARLPAGPLFLTVTTSRHGTKLYFEGRTIREEKGLTIGFPNSGEVRLVLGNSVYGKHSWQGDLYGLAFYQSTLADQDVASHFLQWSKEGGFSFAKTAKPFILFLFDEKEGRWASDYSGGTHSLHIPPRMGVLERKFLVPPRQEIEFNMSSIADIFLNVLGFIPFGFLLSAALADLGGSFSKYGGLITVGLCLMVSLIIEIGQAWLPLRNSSLLDLILNVFGGWIGSRTYLSLCRHLYDKLIQTVSRQLLAG
jgi:VanZ family protein